jgi:hypothetical protein
MLEVKTSMVFLTFQRSFFSTLVSSLLFTLLQPPLLQFVNWHLTLVGNENEELVGGVLVLVFVL